MSRALARLLTALMALYTVLLPFGLLDQGWEAMLIWAGGLLTAFQFFALSELAALLVDLEADTRR